MESTFGASAGAKSASISDLGVEFASAHSEAAENRADIVPDGWHTVSGWCSITGLNRSKLRKQMVDMLEAGMLKMRTFRVKTNGACGLIRTTPHYILVKKSIES